MVAIKLILLCFLAIVVVGCQAKAQPKTVENPPMPIRFVFKKATQSKVANTQLASSSDPTLIGHWIYPNIIATNFRWDLQSTTNFIDWTTEQTNLGPEDVYVRTTNKYKLFRMKGR